MVFKNAALWFAFIFIFYSFINKEGDFSTKEFTNTLSTNSGTEQQRKKAKTVKKAPLASVLYGTASYYATKFQGRKTANGERFDHKKMTAACNSLPLGTWIKVTNLKNKKWVIVKTNDRLHAKTSRLVDLTMAATKQLGFGNAGLTRVKVEVLPKGSQKVI